MTKRIISNGTVTYSATCNECGCRFTYEHSDVHTNYLRGGGWVDCPRCPDCAGTGIVDVLPNDPGPN